MWTIAPRTPKSRVPDRFPKRVRTGAHNTYTYVQVARPRFRYTCTGKRHPKGLRRTALLCARQFNRSSGQRVVCNKIFFLKKRNFFYDFPRRGQYDRPKYDYKKKNEFNRDRVRYSHTYGAYLLFLKNVMFPSTVHTHGP